MDEFYIKPFQTGGLPVECDSNGNEINKSDRSLPVSKFKDKDGKVRRQAFKFRAFETQNDGEVEITLDSTEVESMTWTVRIANKKAVRYNFSMLQGNSMYTTKDFDNSYVAQEIPLRNSKQATNRRQLIIDPGPRTLNGRNQ